MIWRWHKSDGIRRWELARVGWDVLQDGSHRGWISDGQLAALMSWGAAGCVYTATTVHRVEHQYAVVDGEIDG